MKNNKSYVKSGLIAYGAYDHETNNYTQFFTQHQLMEAMKLQVGDRVKVDGRIYRIAENKSKEVFLVGEKNTTNVESISYLVGKVYSVALRPKLVGELKCSSDCSKCPLRAIDCQGTLDKTLYFLLEVYKSSDYFDQEIYDLLKTRLDKEVVD